MILYPALELRDHTPAATAELQAQALHFTKLGFERLYIIDRDAQYKGKAFNIDVVQHLMRETRLPTWVGGGIRDITTVRVLLDAGAERVIVGPMFWLREGLLAETAQMFPGRIVVMIDALGGYVAQDLAQKGAAEAPTRQKVLDLALEFERLGAAGILYMEHEREGAHGHQGAGSLDTEIAADLAFALTVPLYVTGGVNSMADLRALKAEAYTGIAGVILGRALVDGRIDAITALALLAAQDDELS